MASAIEGSATKNARRGGADPSAEKAGSGTEKEV